MPKKLTAIKNWDEIPDMMSPKDYADVMGCSVKTARDKFNSRGFPKVTNGRANKNEVMKFLGINSFETSSDVLKLLLEMQKDIRELKEEQIRKYELLKRVI